MSFIQRARKRVIDTADTVATRLEDAMAKKSSDNLNKALDILMEDDFARILIADAIAGAETEAEDGTSWDEILKAAIADLRSRPENKS